MEPDPKRYPRHKPRPRLAAEAYIGRCQAFLTICVRDRQSDLTAGSTPAHLAFQFGESSGRTGHLISAWVVMPDHVHVLIDGLTPSSDIREWVRHFKQRSAMGYRRATGHARLWQPSFFDRMLRADEPRLRVALYIFANPVRKGLCDVWREWPWSGGQMHERLLADAREGHFLIR